MYQIKQFSRMTGVSIEAIRYYERIGVLAAPRRSENGYRKYTDEDIDRLRFIRRARQLDFTLDNITEILALREQGTQPCEYVQNLIHNKITEIQTRIQELEQLCDELTALDKVEQIRSNSPKSHCICHILEVDPKDQKDDANKIRHTLPLR